MRSFLSKKPNLKCYVAAGGLWFCSSGALLFAQAQSKIDFARDVQPIFKAQCYGCHGPSQQNGALRLDQRSSLLKIGARRIVPTSSAYSLLYRKLSGSTA